MTRIINFADGFTSASEPSVIGSLGVVVQEKSANFTAEYGVTYLTTGALNVQLPALDSAGEFEIKITDTSTITLVRVAAEEIETVAANYAITSDRAAVVVKNNDVDWFLT